MPLLRIQTADDITRFIAQQPAMMNILLAVEALGLPDCWVGAGFVRNVVWDALHGRSPGASYSDVDVVYFDPLDTDRDRDRGIETALKESFPAVPWSVKNQARMHAANGDPPYADTADALRHWPETCTAVAARSAASCIELLAPFGVRDLISLTVNPTPAFAGRANAYRTRIAAKAWACRWPELQINGLRD